MELSHTTTTTTTTTTMQLIVVPPPGVSSFALVARPDTTVADLMLDIAKHTSIPPEQQVLTHGGAALAKTSTVRELGLADGAHLNVSPTLLGGCGCSCCTVL